LSASAKSPWQRWRSLDRPARNMRLEAIWQLAVARVRLARAPVGAILEDLGSGAASWQATTGDVEAAIARAITSAAARVPWRSDCLLQAMAASAMLRKRNHLKPRLHRCSPRPGRRAGGSCMAGDKWWNRHWNVARPDRIQRNPGREFCRFQRNIPPLMRPQQVALAAHALTFC
jgi:hypothetical protein